MSARSSVRSNTMTSTPFHIIEIDGVDVVQHGHIVQTVSIDLNMNSFGTFSIIFGGNEDHPNGLTWIDDDLFTLGRKVSVRMGYSSDQLTNLITGEISNVKVDFPSDGAPSVEISGDDSRSFTISKKRREKSITKRYGDELLSFSPEIDQESQIGGKAPNDLAVINMGSLSASKNEKKMRSKLILDDIDKEMITGIGECVGDTEAVPGRTLALEGLGERFSGNYQLIGSVHTLDRSLGYRTTFTAMMKIVRQ